MRITFLVFSLLYTIGCTTTKEVTLIQTDTMSKTVLASKNAPAAIGPYSQAIQVGTTVWLAGQIALDPASGQLIQGDIVAETRQVMANIKAVLAEANLGFEDIVQAQVYLIDMNEYRAFNEVYAEYFKQAPPARAVVQAARLPRDAKVEIMVTAVKSRP